MSTHATGWNASSSGSRAQATAGRRDRAGRPPVALYWTLRIAAFALRVTPLRASYALARLGGLATYYLWRGGRRRCIGNMLHLSGGDRGLARRYARSSFAYYATYMIDFLRFDALTPDEVRRRIDFDDWPVIDGARTGKGAIFVTVHFGNWDLAAARIAGRGVPLSVIVDSFGHRGLNDLVVGVRERLGMHVIPAERMGSGILRALQRDELVAMLIDIPQPGGGVEVEFFGGVVAVPDGPARVALRTGAAVLAGGLARLGPSSDRFAGVVEQVAFEPTGDHERDVRALTQATMRVLEGLVRQHPEQWYIFRSLWVEDAAAEEAA